MSETQLQVSDQGIFKRYGLYIATILMLIIWFLPSFAGVPVVGQRAIGILVFAIIVWASECMSYPVSAFVILALISFGCGLAPAVDNPEKLYGTSNALKLGLSGFSSPAWALVMAALFLAAAMMITRLDKRIALWVMSLVGTKSKNMVIGAILIGAILSFFVPSTTARVSCVVPIVLGMISAFGVKQGSKFAAVMMIAVAQADSLWNVGVKTAAAQNQVALGFIDKMLGTTISWLDWLIAAAPYAIVMSVVLYFIIIKIIPPEIDEVPGGRDTIAKMQAEMGKISPNEIKLLAVSFLLLFFWATEKKLHPFDTNSVTLAGIAYLFLPKLGVMSWNDAVGRINWGTILLFGVGIGLGTTLLKTDAAAYLGNQIVDIFGIKSMSALMIIAVFGLFLIFVHLGFASATALASAMIPIVISVLQTVETSGINVLGMTMILQFVVCFGFILPVNAPQNMIAFSTGYFTVRQFVITGIPLTIAAYLLILLFSATYWHWLGLC